MNSPIQLRLLTTGLMLIIGTRLAVGADGGSAVTPDTLINGLLASNPQLHSMEAEWKSARQQAVIVGALPDPMFTFGHYLSSVETRVGPMQEKIGLSQRFPWFGKLSAAKQAAAKEAGAQEMLWRAAGETFALETAMAYVDVAYSREAQAVIEKQIVVTGELQKAAERIYSAPTQKAGQEDILRFSVMADRMRDRTIALRENEALALDRIERLMGGRIARGAAFTLGAAQAARRTVPKNADARFTSAFLQRPEMLAAELRLDAAALRTRLARLDYFPDVTLGFDYTVVGEANASMTRPSDSGKDAAMVFFSINLPIWLEKRGAQVESAREMERAHAAKIDDLRAAIRREIQEAQRNAQAADESVQLHREKLVPESERARELSLSEYSAGKQNYINVLDAENTVLDLRLKLIEAEAKAVRARWKLFRALGVASLSGVTKTATTRKGTK